VVPDDLHDFFVASGGVAGALIGLLFVAISVSGERLAARAASAPMHRIRAAAALSSFLNALTVSLFGLIPGQKIGWTAVAVGCTGVLFIVAALLSLIRLHLLWSRRVVDVLFLLGMLVAFAFQIRSGLHIARHPDDADAISTVAVIVVVFFLIGVYRSWELIGGPSFGVRREVTELIRHPKEANSEGLGDRGVDGGQAQ
jgi:hypothetical protein